jgi:hypothetical protein
MILRKRIPGSEYTFKVPGGYAFLCVLCIVPIVIAAVSFFINGTDNDFLDHAPGNYGYAVFGRVTSGMDVVDAIATVPTTRRRGHGDVPVDEVVITAVRRVEAA